MDIPVRRPAPGIHWDRTFKDSRMGFSVNSEEWIEHFIRLQHDETDVEELVLGQNEHSDN